MLNNCIREIDSIDLRQKLNNREVNSLRSSGHMPTTISPSIIKEKPEVYKVVYDEKLCVLKYMPVFIGKDNAIQRESQALKILNKAKISPRLFKDFQKDIDERYFYMIYEYLEDGKWNDLVIFRRKMLREIRVHSDEYKEIIDNFKEFLIDRVNKMHSLGIVHGDLKPSHIFVKIDDAFKLEDIKFIDFGLSYRLKKSFKKTHSKWQGGTIGYSPPINWAMHGNHDISEKEKIKLDFYGAYSSMFFLLTGESFLLSYPAYNKTGLQNLDTLRDKMLKSYQHYYLVDEVIDKLCNNVFFDI